MLMIQKSYVEIYIIFIDIYWFIYLLFLFESQNGLIYGVVFKFKINIFFLKLFLWPAG